MNASPLVLRSHDLVASGLDDRSLRHAAAAGRLVRLRPGVYMQAGVWESMGPRDRALCRVHAAACILSGPVVVSHWSAAAVWNLPVPDAWPDRLEVIDVRCRGVTSRPRLLRRPGGLEAADVVEWEGVRVTSAARTAADIALTSPFDHAVLVLDAGLALGLFSKEEVLQQLARRPGARRARSAVAAVEFADGAAQSPGESFSRCGMAGRGLLLPTLQEPFFEHGRLVAVADFWWESLGLVGEFDGEWKYSDPRWLRGRTPSQAILDEKRRQDRLDAHPRVERVIRWDYAVARDPDELARRLLNVGVPRLEGARRHPRHA